jgi:hypothetical protein
VTPSPPDFPTEVAPVTVPAPTGITYVDEELTGSEFVQHLDGRWHRIDEAIPVSWEAAEAGCGQRVVPAAFASRGLPDPAQDLCRCVSGEASGAH